ncbi:transposase zinc-binding domain-containing protein [Escherichia coli]
MKNFSNAGGWSMAFYGFAASLATPSTRVAFSCKRRGFCPSCGARRMAESAALLVDEVLPEQPMRQWVLSFPFQLRFLFGGRLREGAESYAKALASDILR